MVTATDFSHSHNRLLLLLLLLELILFIAFILLEYTDENFLCWKGSKVWDGVVEVGSLLVDSKRDFIFVRATKIGILVAEELQSFVSFQGVAGVQ